MVASLFVEHCPNGLAFYINGELQFHTEDEQIYHEYLVAPAIALAVQRFPHTSLRILICGGGDGLAAREALKFSEVSHIDLVDYNPDVLELGRTVFAPFNQASLSNSKVIAHSQDAFEFVENSKSRTLYHVVICDFTYPNSDAETRVKSKEWFELVRQVLHPQGLVAENAVSPERKTLGYWCLYQTMWSAGLQPKPMTIQIPSFHRQGLGDWGFLIASSDRPIAKSEILNAEFPTNLRALNLENLLATFVFEKAIADRRTQVAIHSLKHPQILYYLLNPQILEDPACQASESAQFDFLAISDLDELTSVTQSLMRSMDADSNTDPLRLESLAKRWLTEIESSQPEMRSLLPPLLPAQHAYHTPKMTAAWLHATQHAIAQIDLPRLLQKILERGKNLPANIRHDIKQLLTALKASDPDNPSKNPSEFQRDIQEFQRWEPQTSTQPTSTVPATIAKLVAVLSVTLLVANAIAPDSVFAKGVYYGGSGSGVDGDVDGDGGGGWSWGSVGIFLTMGGVMWLLHLASQTKKSK